MDPNKHLDNFAAMFRVDRKIHYIVLSKTSYNYGEDIHCLLMRFQILTNFELFGNLYINIWFYSKRSSSFAAWACIRVSVR